MQEREEKGRGEQGKGGQIGEDSEGPVVPVQWAREWFGNERLPVGWVRPVQSIGLLATIGLSKTVGRLVDGILAKTGGAS